MPRDRLCIIIPAYNPGEELCRVVHELLSRDSSLRFLVVNDGSQASCAPVFEELARYDAVTVLRHAVNLGKGAALKTAFNQALLMEGLIGVVTADADGQHLAKDILATADMLRRNPSDLVLGIRAFSAKAAAGLKQPAGPGQPEGDAGDDGPPVTVPLRSRIGNAATALVVRFLLGEKIRDTQTGLRGIPLAMLPALLRIKALRYDFEMEMLVAAVNISPESVARVMCQMMA